MDDNLKIKILKGPDRVRCRPAVIFGSEDLEGVQQAINGLLEIFAAEAEAGYCTALTVKQDGAQLEISCNDRGLYLGQDRNDDVIWQERLCMLFAGPAYREEYTFDLTDHSDAYLFSGQAEENAFSLGAMHLACVQCASAYMDVTVVRDGMKCSLHFRKGYNEGGMQKEPCTQSTGTTICYAPDEEVFTQTVIPEAYLQTRLQQLALTCPGLCCTYIGSAGQSRYCYQGGIREYLQEKTDLPVFYTSLEATGRERYDRAPYTARVEIAAGLCPKPEHLCIHNFRVLTRGGSHYEALRDRLELAFRGIAEPDAVSVVLLTRCATGATNWQNATRQSLGNIMLRDMTEDAASKPLSDFVYQHKAELKKGHP